MPETDKSANELEQQIKINLKIIGLLRKSHKGAALDRREDTYLAAIDGDITAQASVVAEAEDNRIAVALDTIAYYISERNITPEEGLTEAKKELGRELTDLEKDRILSQGDYGPNSLKNC